MAKVIIIGGGVAGMSAAHELIERNFEVEVYDSNAKYCGGKARSVNVEGTNTQHPDKYLPGEHGFRFFPGFYKHVTDTMKRIPFGEQSFFHKPSCYDNLVPTENIMVARYGKAPIVVPASFPHTLEQIKLIIHDIMGGVDSGLTKEEEEFFAARIWQLLTSCWDRRLNRYERIGWWEFCEADRFSETYQHLCVEGLTRTLVAAQAESASTKTGGDIVVQLILTMLDPFVNTDRVLNGPTNDQWLTPWLNYLTGKGVKYNFGQAGYKIDTKITDTKTTVITGVWVRDAAGKETLVTGDYYLFAVPVEVMAPLLTPEIIKADESLNTITELANDVQWMNGLQFYLNEDVQINPGHVIYADSQWALTSISQIQYWNGYDLSDRYNGKVKGILSVDISDWFDKGFNGKLADECSPDDIQQEVWHQLKNSLNINGQEILKDSMKEFWHLDHDISQDGKIDKDREPLLVNKVNTWTLRPTAYTNLPNMFLASDYCQTFTDLATMEGANESARRAVNCIINAADSDADYCKVWNLHEPMILAPFRDLDQKRWEKGLPWKNML